MPARPTRIPQTLAEFVEHWWTGTQVELARELGISEGHLSNLIGGHRLPSGDLAVRIHDVTGIPIKALLQPPQTSVEVAS